MIVETLVDVFAKQRMSLKSDVLIESDHVKFFTLSSQYNGQNNSENDQYTSDCDDRPNDDFLRHGHSGMREQIMLSNRSRGSHEILVHLNRVVRQSGLLVCCLIRLDIVCIELVHLRFLIVRRCWMYRWTDLCLC